MNPQIPPSEPAPTVGADELRAPEAPAWRNNLFGDTDPLSALAASSAYDDDPDLLSEGAIRNQQELEDERLARQLQAEEEAAAAAVRLQRANAGQQEPNIPRDPILRYGQSNNPLAPPAPAPAPPPEPTRYRTPPRDPLSDTPDDQVGLFRCGACSETMHVKNAVHGAQFQCPLCGRLNTYVSFSSPSHVTHLENYHSQDLSPDRRRPLRPLSCPLYARDKTRVV